MLDKSRVKVAAEARITAVIDAAARGKIKKEFSLKNEFWIEEPPCKFA